VTVSGSSERRKRQRPTALITLAAAGGILVLGIVIMLIDDDEAVVPTSTSAKKLPEVTNVRGGNTTSPKKKKVREGAALSPVETRSPSEPPRKQSEPERPPEKPPKETPKKPPEEPPRYDQHGFRFASEVWKKGSQWIYRTKRISTKKRKVDEVAPLSFHTRFTVVSVSGGVVRISADGGILGKDEHRHTSFSEQCLDMLSGSGKNAMKHSFCVTGQEQKLNVRVGKEMIKGYKVTSRITWPNDYKRSDSEGEVVVSRDYGLLRIKEPGNRGRTIRERTLVGFKVGSKVGGKYDLTTVTCDWDNVDKGNDGMIASYDQLSSLVARKLGRVSEGFDLALKGNQGASRVVAFTDGKKTVARIEGIRGGASNGFVVRGGLQAVKAWDSPDGRAEYVLMTTLDDSTVRMHVFELKHGEVSGEHHLASRKPRRMIAVRGYLSNHEDECVFMLAVKDRKSNTRVAKYRIDGKRKRRLGGSLSVY